MEPAGDQLDDPKPSRDRKVRGSLPQWSQPETSWMTAREI